LPPDPVGAALLNALTVATCVANIERNASGWRWPSGQNLKQVFGPMVDLSVCQCVNFPLWLVRDRVPEEVKHALATARIGLEAPILRARSFDSDAHWDLGENAVVRKLVGSME
jgi:hypothetical protein